MWRHIMKKLLLILLLVALAVASAQAYDIKETNIVTWSGTAWTNLTKGQLYSYTTPTAAATMAVGGGYDTSGCTIAGTGNISTNGALVVDGISTLTGAVGCAAALTADNIVCTNAATFGGGYASTGATITTGGALSIAGALVVDGASTLTGATTITGALTQTGAVTCASTLTSKRLMATDISGATATLAVATTPSGAVQTISANTCAVTLPALNAGVTYTFIMLGTTSFTLTGPSACLLCDSIATAKTNIVWSTSPVNLCVTVVSTASNWVVTSFTLAPDSSS
jgi:hypothetical protein